MFGIFRFILAMNVMIFHVLAIKIIGPYAVYTFFVLSGFLMTTIMHKTYGYTANGLMKYAANRALRLFPIYWFLLLLIFLAIFIIGEQSSLAYHSAMKIPRNLSEWLANIFLVYPEFKPVQYPVRLSPPSWALSIELFFYLLIGLGMTQTKKISLFIFSLSLILVIYQIVIGKGIGYGNVLEASLPFSLGGVIFHYKYKLKALIDILPPNRVLIVGLSALCLNMFFAMYIQSLTEQTFLFLATWKIGALCTLFNIFCSGFVIISLYYSKSQNTVLKKLDRELGDLSYPLYIFHTAAAWIVATWLYKDNMVNFREPNPLVFIFALLLTIFVCWITNKFINEWIESIRANIKSDKVKIKV